MRKLQLSDVFRLSEMIDTMGINLDLNKLMDTAKSKDGDAQENVGAEIAFVFVKNLYKAENLAYEFISELTGDSLKEVKKYKLKQIKAFFKELLDDEEFTDFFQQA